MNDKTGIFVFQVEVENFVLKMAAEFPSRRDQLIFLINNYDMMLSVLMVSCMSLSLFPGNQTLKKV